jgi:two-component system, sensor histidine kinase ChiS
MICESEIIEINGSIHRRRPAPAWGEPRPTRSDSSDCMRRLEDSDAAHFAPRSIAATILCVDDDPDVLQVLDWFLTSDGFVVRRAASGDDALLQVKEQLPDLVITDYAMPGMTGLQLCKSLRAQLATRHIPIILYSAFHLPPDSCFYDRTFLKPTDVAVFGSAIRALLSLRH